MDRPDCHLLPLRLLGDLRRDEGHLHQSGVCSLQHGRDPVAGVPGCVLAPVPPRRGRRRPHRGHQRPNGFRQPHHDRRRSGPAAHGGVYADQRLVRHEYSFRPGGGTADPGRGAVPGEPLLGGQAVLCYHYRQGDFAKSLSGPQVGEVDPVHADHADLPVRPSGVRHPFLRGLHQDLGI